MSRRRLLQAVVRAPAVAAPEWAGKLDEKTLYAHQDRLKWLCLLLYECGCFTCLHQ